MFYINKNTELDAGLLNKMINRFHLNNLPYLEKKVKLAEKSVA